MTLLLTEASLREPLRAALAARVPWRAGGAGTAAAVLVPLFEREGEVHTWFVKRPAAMRRHGGQVAFPGGKQEPDDASLMHTALREAHEEIGVAPAVVDVLGALDDYVTVTGYVVTPWVGWVPPDVPLTPDPVEVARVFDAPLRRFVGAAEDARMLDRLGYAIDGELVWGATAAMARALGAIVREVVARAG